MTGDGLWPMVLRNAASTSRHTCTAAGPRWRDLLGMCPAVVLFICRSGLLAPEDEWGPLQAHVRNLGRAIGASFLVLRII